MRTSKEKISLFILFQCYAEGRQPRNKDILQLKKGRPHLRTKVTSITIYLPADNIRRAFNKITHSSWLTKTWLNNTVWSTWSVFRQTVRTNIDVEDDFYILLFIYTHIFRVFGKQYVYIYILTSVVYHKQYGCKIKKKINHEYSIIAVCWYFYFAIFIQQYINSYFLHFRMAPPLHR